MLKFRNYLFSALLLLGLWLMTFGIDIYINTIIDLEHTLIIIFVASIISYGTDLIIFSKVHKTQNLLKTATNMGLNTVSTGFIICYLFLAVNYSLVNAEKDQLRLKR